MPVVVDTHILVWDQLDPGKLSAKARRAILRADEEGKIIVCEISLWEIASLMHRKRLVLNSSYLDFVRDLLLSRSFILHGINPEIADMTTWLEISSKDPADRIIASTSYYLNLPLITADTQLLQSKTVETIW
jgi:PIN domain nuclease of toxin-antitoxin system